MPARMRTRSLRKAFTIPELLVVIGIIALLIAMILPAFSGARQTANMAKSMTRLKQVFTWMQAYSSENREYIVPSQFDYTASAATYAVKVRSDVDLPPGERFRGTWTDILWVYGKLGEKQALVDQSQPANTDKYFFDSPDRAAYENDPDFESPFRSPEMNSHDYVSPPADGIALPFGQGATESGLPGYFAANNFFNADSTSPTFNGWFVTGQIKAPDRSMYVVDSVAGEVIEADGAVGGPWDNPLATASNGVTIPRLSQVATPNVQVDFRYNGACLMLMLDGHAQAEAPWKDLADLQVGRKIKVQNLTQN